MLGITLKGIRFQCDGREIEGPQKEMTRPVNCALEKMAELGVSWTVKNYVTFAYLGGRTYESLEGEGLAEVHSLVNAGRNGFEL
jgi:hypothetical protein